VVVGTADAAAEATAAGVHDPGDTMVMYGSSMFFIQVCASLPASRVQWPTTYLHPGSYALAGGMSTAGALLTWFRDRFGPAAAPDSGFGADDDGFAALAQEADRVAPGSDGLLVLPYLMGERTPVNDPHARGVLLGLTLAHTRGHVYRALIEGIAYGVRHNIEAMDAAGVPPGRLVAIGGGTRSPLWVQTVSDATGRPQQVQRTPGAALGDAMLAAWGVGLVDRLRDTRAWIPEGPIARPDPATRALHDERYRLFRELYRDTARLAHAVTSGSPGPGSPEPGPAEAASPHHPLADATTGVMP
jgi:xylulokinase